MLYRHPVNLNSSGQAWEARPGTGGQARHRRTGQAQEDRPDTGGQGHFRKHRWVLCLGEYCLLKYLSQAESWGSTVNTVKSVSTRKLKSGKHLASKEATEV